VAARLGELERVLQQVGEREGQHLAIAPAIQDRDAEVALTERNELFEALRRDASIRPRKRA
jgi:hypothetical protein